MRRDEHEHTRTKNETCMGNRSRIFEEKDSPKHTQRFFRPGSGAIAITYIDGAKMRALELFEERDLQ